MFVREYVVDERCVWEMVFGEKDRGVEKRVQSQIFGVAEVSKMWTVPRLLYGQNWRWSPLVPHTPQKQNRKSGVSAAVRVCRCWAGSGGWSAGRSVRRGEKRRFTVVFSSFPLFFSSLFVFLSPSVSRGLQCRASGSLALARSLRLFWCWLSAGGRVSAAVVLALALLSFRFWLWFLGGSAAGAVSVS